MCLFSSTFRPARSNLQLQPLSVYKKLTGQNASLQIVGARKDEEVAVQGLYGCCGQLYSQVSCGTLARVVQVSEASANVKLSARSNRRPPLTPNYQREAIGGLRYRQTIGAEQSETSANVKLSARSFRRPPLTSNNLARSFRRPPLVPNNLARSFRRPTLTPNYQREAIGGLR